VEAAVVTDTDRARAQACAECPVCSRAREKQRGLAYWFVKRIEGGICPYCRAYEKVYGRRAHEPVPAEEA
jgi:Zn ribbon nucleic-acid-binding protein